MWYLETRARTGGRWSASTSRVKLTAVIRSSSSVAPPGDTCVIRSTPGTYRKRRRVTDGRCEAEADGGKLMAVFASARTFNPVAQRAAATHRGGLCHGARCSWFAYDQPASGHAPAVRAPSGRIGKLGAGLTLKEQGCQEVVLRAHRPSSRSAASSLPVKPAMSTARDGAGGSKRPLQTLHTSCRTSWE